MNLLSINFTPPDMNGLLVPPPLTRATADQTDPSVVLFLRIIQARFPRAPRWVFRHSVVMSYVRENIEGLETKYPSVLCRGLGGKTIVRPPEECTRRHYTYARRSGCPAPESKSFTFVAHPRPEAGVWLDFLKQNYQKWKAGENGVFGISSPPYTEPSFELQRCSALLNSIQIALRNMVLATRSN
jgi:hypothetical protein